MWEALDGCGRLDWVKMKEFNKASPIPQQRNLKWLDSNDELRRSLIVFKGYWTYFQFI